MTFEDQCDLSRNLKGAAASILLALLLSGRTLTGEQLEVATSYSDKPIRKALNWLEPRHFVQYNGHNKGWSLGPAAIETFIPAYDHLFHTQTKPPRRITLPPQSPGRPATIYPKPEGPNGRAPSTISDRNTRLEYQVKPRTQTRTDRNNPEPDQSQPRNNSEPDQSQPRKNSEPDQSQPRKNPENAQMPPRKNAEQSSEKRRPSPPKHQIPPRSQSDLPDDLTKTPTDHQLPDLAQENRNNSELAQFLDRLNIREPAFSRILETCDTPLVLAWWWRAIEQKWLDNPIGWTIRRLEYQEQPPAAYLEIAQAWLSLDQEQKNEMRTASFVHGGLERFWQNRNLSRTAVHILSPIHRSGGFRAFDDD